MSEYADLLIESIEYMLEAIESFNIIVEEIRTELIADCLAYE